MKTDRNFMKNAANLMKNESNSPRSPHNEDKIQNSVPVFETSNNKRMVGDLPDDKHQQIIEIDGKRYLVIQELDPPNDGNNHEDDGDF